MLFRARPSTLADLLAHRDALAFGYGDDAALLARLPEAWAGLLALPSVWSVTVEDADAPPERRVVYLSMTAFVSQAFAVTLASGTAPLIGAQVARRFLQAGDEPLDEEAMAEQNRSEGLCGVNIHSVCPQVAPGEQFITEIGEYVAAQNFRAMRGYRIQRSLRDVFSPSARRGYEAGGWRLRTDNGLTEPSVKRPHVLGFDREDAQTASGARMAALFVEYPRRLHLRPAHRELLQAALSGLGDEEIAGQLGISLSAVKKRWLTVYEHVEERMPNLFPADPSVMRPGRGVERRRHLLAYVRDHPEEFAALND